MHSPDRAPVFITLHNQAKQEEKGAEKVGLSSRNDLEFQNRIFANMAFQI